MYSGKKAQELLANPYAHEEIGNLFIFELPGLGDFPNQFWDSVEDFQNALLALPAVSCGIQQEMDSKLNATPDILLLAPKDEDDIKLLQANVEKNPVASLLLAQLLRLGDRLELRDCLVAESMTYSVLQSGQEFQTWLKLNKKKAKKAKTFSEPAVLVERSDGQLSLTLNRPEKHNAFSSEMRDLLVETLRVAFVDESLNEILLNANGESFCSGGDLDEFGTTPDPATAHQIRSSRNVGWWIHLLHNKVKVKLHGACIGAGIELAAFADYVQASEDAYFCLPEVGLGLVPGAGGTASIPRRIGRQRTAWLALTGERISAETALLWGLIDDIN